MKRSTLVFSMCIAALTRFAVADEPPAPPQPRGGEVRAACEADVKKLCADVAPGGGRVMQCLKEHKEEVSDGCKQAIMKARQGAADNKS
ncbi:MAG TPA: cysteine rich repeat-containing protein [Steroidobacteraceae bacterium]